MRYSAKFKEKMIEKMMSPNAHSATSLAEDTGVTQNTLSRWLREAKLAPMKDATPKTGSGSGRKRWTSEEKLRVVREATVAGEAGLGMLLRREGLHQADLERFREEVLEAAALGFQSRRKSRGPTAEQRRIGVLEKELRRKERALAETAALLVLRKKSEALFPLEEEGDDTNGSSE